MGDLSDLDLVAKAMAPTNAPDKPTPKPHTKAETKPTNPPSADDNLDISSLSDEDYALLEPLLRALELSGSDVLDEASMADVLRQMDVAGNVADNLEGKLDRLIGQLSEVEEGIVADVGDEKAGKVPGGTVKGDKKKEEEKAILEDEMADKKDETPK
jgi:hypothetical protein